MRSLLDKKKLFIILFLVLLIAILNKLVFSNQLNYGFRDVDWQVLYYFKLFGKLSLNHLLQEIRVLGVYISESYYVGFLEKWIGLNFFQLYLFTHFLKVISAVSLYMLILKVFKRKLLAFVASLIYSVSYTHAGVLFQLSSGGYFLATIFMNLFLIAYYNYFTEKKRKWLALFTILLIVAFILKPERMYSVIFFLLIIESFMVTSGRFKKERLAIFLPLIILYPIYLSLFTTGVPQGFAPGQFSIGMQVKFKSILNGNFQSLTDPFASLGSIFLYGDYWKFLGGLNFGSLSSYIISLIFGPIIRLGILTFILISFIHGKVFKSVAFITVAIFIFGLAIYALSINWQNIPLTMRIHFEPELTALPAIFGFYITSLVSLFFIRFIKNHDKDLIIPVIGITFAYLFILMTWTSSDVQLIFMGPHRYLSIPSIGTSLFIAWILVIIFDKLRKSKARTVAWTIFLILGIVILINYKVANNFFNDELNSAGMRGTDQIKMKDEFRSLVGKIDTQDRSLFYFDETQDKDNAYFNEGTVLAGFEYWLKFNKDGTLSNIPTPGMMRSTRQCPEHTHQNCISILREGLKVENNQLGIWYKDPIKGNIENFYKLNNFHAYRFVNKDIIDIKDEVLRELGL